MSSCPGVREMTGVYDNAFKCPEEGHCDLVLSEAAQNLNDTFCSKCYRGIVSHGPAGGEGSKEREALLEVLGGIRWTLSATWSPPSPRVASTLVVNAPDGLKQDSVREIVNWLRTDRKVHIDHKHVHFFDDNDVNAPAFDGTGFNARQVSCGTRSGTVGQCGARIGEIIAERGVKSCDGHLIPLAA